MKKKWIIGGAIVLLVVVAIVAVLLVKQNQTPPEGTEPVSVEENCWEHVTNMHITEQANGTAQVTLTAPDYVLLAKLLAAENNDSITAERITQAVKDNPEAVKEYTFTAFSVEEYDVKAALMEQIAYELIGTTLMDLGGR